MTLEEVLSSEVVFVVQQETFLSMRRFCESRFLWMKSLKNPQASTVMVEGIPDEYQSDEKVGLGRHEGRAVTDSR